MTELDTTTKATPLLSARDVVKRFGAVVAIDGVSLDVYEGDVLGIVGDNGAGKSTFLSMLSGYLQPDAGELRLRDERVRLRSPAQTRRALGIEMVYQDLAVAPDLSVWRNLFLGEEVHRFGVLRRAEMRRRAQEVLRRMNTKIEPDWLASDLSGGERQLVAVARGLLFDRDIILLDEPTAAVSAAKSAEVIDTIRDLHAHGKTIIIVSHRLEDVLAVCSRVAVFRAGRVADVVSTEGLSVADLVHLTFGGPQRPADRQRRDNDL